MEAKDLRIGNYIQFKANKLPLKVRTNHIQNIEDDFHSDIVEPIEITEEWLLKLGLERKSQGEEFVWVANHYMFANPDFGWYFKFKRNGFLSFCYGELFVKDVKSVHQLQNLYFALTEDELIPKNL